jgi:hypothetical protein
MQFYSRFLLTLFDSVECGGIDVTTLVSGSSVGGVDQNPNLAVVWATGFVTYRPAQFCY